MRTALPANTKTRPNVVSMLVQRRWRWANIETALGQMLAFAGLHTGVCLHPPLRHHNIHASRSRQPANHKLTTILEIVSGGHLHILTCEGAVSRVSCVDRVVIDRPINNH